MKYPNLALMMLMIVLNIITVTYFGLIKLTISAVIFTNVLFFLSMIDWQSHRLPDNLTLSLLWLGLLLNISACFVSLEQAVLGAAAGYMAMCLFTRAFYLCTGKIGMGQGDWKLFSALGAWFGWQALPEILVKASFSGLIVCLLMIGFGKWRKNDPIPFGPFLAFAGWIRLFIS